MRRAAYVAEDLISCDKVYILIYNYVYKITTSYQYNLRNVGIAGSNAVTMPIYFRSGDMGNSLAPNGFGAHSTRPAS
jgi:hypothetical protein